MSSADFSIRDVKFHRTADSECDVVVFGETVGSVMKRADIANPDGGFFYAAHLRDDHRGPVLIDRREQVRPAIAALLIERDLVPSTPPPVHPAFSLRRQRAA